MFFKEICSPTLVTESGSGAGKLCDSLGIENG